MRKNYRFKAQTVCLLLAIGMHASAQDERWSPSLYLQASDKADVTLPFSVTAQGKKYAPDWGLDLAWINEQNLARGVNHMGKKNVTLGRSSYRVGAPLTGDTALVKEQWQGMNERNQLFNKYVSDTLAIVLNCDNGFSSTASPTAGSNIGSYYTSGGRANVAHWAAMLDAHVSWMQRNSRHPVVGVSIMNEPDFKGNENELIQGTAADIRDIGKKLREDYPRFKDLVITGPNTLNDDQAMPWYNTCKDYVDWGNTHQLAGSFNNYAGFHEQLAKDGKVGMNDEMHNVAEAFIGLEYGMTKGIWWGFDSRARGEFCQISREGSRLAYGEHRNNWTAATVYRNDQTGQVKAFVGGSERQAYTTTYQFVSLDDVVYYDGCGPFHELRVELPGGTGYQKGQTNAECVIDVTWGEDVAPAPINGTYLIMNKYNRQLVAQGGTTSGQTGIQLEFYSNKTSQQWKVTPVSNRVGGDFSFFDIASAGDGRRINVLNHSVSSGAALIAYNAGGDINEQWYLVYAGNGCYYIRNRESALYLTAASRSQTAGVKLVQNTLLSGMQADRQLWRIIPIDAECETTAPAQPVGLTATARPASVYLSWTANAEDDLDGYMVLRADKATGQWNTIARKVKASWFVDNTCRQGHEYLYKVKAIDRSDNQSDPSETAEGQLAAEPSLIACYDFEDNLQDATPNMMDAAAFGRTNYVTTQHKSGQKALSFVGSNYVQLPYELASSPELTVAMWVYWVRSGSSNTWQRIFDFGNGTDQYIFLTPDCGTGMRLAVKNGGQEQQVNCPTRLLNGLWKHVAVTFGSQKTTIYVDGEEVASSALTISPADVHPVMNFLGRSQFTSDPYFTGYIDNLQVFNYVLDAEGVKKAMDEASTGIHEAGVPAGAAAPRSVYDLQGRKIANGASAPRGTSLRMVDGRKVVVK